ncbi:twin-arginine translocase TatA/TatE family subunit [Pelolinea submarina]|jgi:sec-independent protein translocase protein TatA|uniref:Sec-independent protein translocase protein TatA n=1 Tax=Pelolinea submarina TaxID=913107 RepID=A0A347ZWF9_9CHLR|nr:twin-arginine translocase TatA/TatE family subunit [Pelolinea submarina]REG05383.1 sec-independent protein translocase protein TatA [Pelolinea submarina]BBB49640.1 sec-independent protein translocase protein TatA [Pelolinea submarina]
MPRLGTWEIIIVLVIVLLVFGPGRITKVASEMGKGIKAFKDGLNEDKSEKDESAEESESETKK